MLTVNMTIAVLINLLNHDLEILIREVFSKGLHQLAELIDRDSSTAVLVEDIEGATHLIIGVRWLGLDAHHLDEFWHMLAKYGEEIGWY